MAEMKIFVFMGMIASGKSTLARLWAEREGLACYNSDVVRKELAGSAPEDDCRDDFGGGIYTPEMTRRTYDALLDLAGAELGGGRSVVLDASYSAAGERTLVLALAERVGARPVFVHCFCADDETARRLEIRAQDPDAVSDGTWQVYLKQKTGFEPPAELASGMLVAMDTNKPPSLLLADLATVL